MTVRISKKMLKEFDDLTLSINNDSLNIVHIIPDYYIKLLNDWESIYNKVKLRGYDIGTHSITIFKLKEIKTKLKELEEMKK